MLVEAPLKQHIKFIEWLNKREYPMEGKRRKGYCRPHPSIILPYDIRIKREVMDAFFKDMHDNAGLLPGVHGHFGKISQFIYKLWNKFGPFEEFKYKKYTNAPVVKDPLPGWIYLMILGTIKDPVDEHGNELL